MEESSGMDARALNFAAAGPEEVIVHGSRKPDASSEGVEAWAKFMRGAGIVRVCCLLDRSQLSLYRPSLESQYAQHFGAANVCMAPITDYQLAQPELLRETILPFLRKSDGSKQPVVVHCWSGNGRTGHVLAAWLVAGRGQDPMEAIRTVEGTGRKPREAISHGNATLEELIALLRQCCDQPSA
jgi:protein-tyrosine phosphatase